MAHNDETPSKPRKRGRPPGSPNRRPRLAVDGQPVAAALRVVAGLDMASMPARQPQRAALRGQGKNEHGLTAKREAFAQSVAAGNTLTASYKAAYNAENMTAHCIVTEASKMMSNPEVANRVNMLVEAKSRRTTHDAARIKATVIERLQIEASDKANPASVRVRALELLGKLTDVAAFRERITTEAVDVTVDDLEAQLEERLRSLLKSA